MLDDEHVAGAFPWIDEAAIAAFIGIFAADVVILQAQQGHAVVDSQSTPRL